MLLPNKYKLFRVIGTKILPNVKHLRQLSTETVVPVKLSYTTYVDSKVDESKLAPPLVVVHGMLESKSSWTSICEAYQQKLLPKRKVIAIDCRNHGDSPHDDDHTYDHLAADIREFIKEINADKVALIGHSMGGRSIMLFALKYPELVDKLIVADISPVTSTHVLDTAPLLFAALKSVRLPENVSPSEARSIVDKQLAKTIPAEEVRAFVLTNLVQTDDKKFKWKINIPVIGDHFNNIARFPHTNLKFLGPTLFLAGEHSKFLRESHLPEIKELFPNAKLGFIKGSGHLIHTEKPQEFISKSVDFLNEVN